MSKKYRNNMSNALTKYREKLGEARRKLEHSGLRARALCTHTSEPGVPNLAFKKDQNGKVYWVCRICDERVDLNRISDDELKHAISVVNQACNMIKIMSRGTEYDQRMNEKVISDIQLKINAYLFSAYKGAVAASANQKNRQNGTRRSRVSWE